MYLHTWTLLQGAIRWELVGGFPVRELAASNHMSREGRSSGSRPGLGGNQQHMNRILGRGKEDEGAMRGRTERQASSLSSANADITHCGQAIRRKHTDAWVYVFVPWNNTEWWLLPRRNITFRLQVNSFGNDWYIFPTALILMNNARYNIQTVTNHWTTNSNGDRNSRSEECSWDQHWKTFGGDVPESITWK